MSEPARPYRLYRARNPMTKLDFEPIDLPSNLLGVSEIAERLNVKPNTVSQWRLRNIDFPAPLVDLSMGPVWWAPDIDAWAESR